MCNCTSAKDAPTVKVPVSKPPIKKTDHITTLSVSEDFSLPQPPAIEYAPDAAKKRPCLFCLIVLIAAIIAVYHLIKE